MTLYVLVGACITQAVVSTWLAWDSGTQSWLPTVAISIIIAAGLLLRRRWTEHLIFGLMVLGAVSYLCGTAIFTIKGWPHSDLLFTFLSLMPGLLYCGFWIAMWQLTKMYFRGQQVAQG
jgi:hypothetical protein